jgi:hypothetical protein
VGGVANRAKSVYVSDITVGELPQLRGHWIDRLGAIDADIVLMSKQADRVKSGDISQERVESAIKATLGRPRRATVACQHRPAAKFQGGQALGIELSIEKASTPVSARLYYRHVTQTERYEALEMEPRDGRYHATIPADYTNRPYPLEYYFELKQGSELAWLYPGFGEDLTNQPYFVVWRGGGMRRG